MHARTLFLVCASAIVLAAPAAAVPHPLRLFQIPATLFSVDDHGQRWAQRGQFDSFGAFRVESTDPVPESVALPVEALNRVLIHEDAWLAYQRLGPEAVANFAIVGDVFWIPVGARYYAPLAVREDARFDLGDLINISARSVVTPGGEPLIGGFIIEHQPRRVLIRGIGPTLAEHGVITPLPDPYLNIHQHGSGTVIWYNDNWNERYDAAEIKAISAVIGAFPLPDGSKDAAYLVELPPGAYTAHLTTYGDSGGTALLEVYILP